MKRPLRVGLVVEGNSTRSAVLRLPKLREIIGPIKAASPRVARRLSNFLRAGYVAHDYEELEDAGLILLRIPDEAVPRTVAELAVSDLPFKRLSFVLCETWLSADSLSLLSQRGAAVATLTALPGRRNWFLVEGDLPAVRPLRILLESNGARAIEIRPGTKSLCFAAGILAAALPMPLYLAAQDALRSAGITGNNLSTILDEMSQSMFREFVKGARATWGGPLTETNVSIRADHLLRLETSSPELAITLDAYLRLAKQTFSRQRAPRKLAEPDKARAPGR
jgi:predicted short-subunit dehydrogenase-like oxidoreductase (DUF2520 family)